jgi:hypothetical protein
MEIVGWEGIVDNLGQLFSSTPQANNTKPTSNNCEVFAPGFPSLLLAVLQFHSQRFQLFTPWSDAGSGQELMSFCCSLVLPTRRSAWWFGGWAIMSHELLALYWDVNGDLLHRETGQHVGHRPIETGDLGDLIIFDIHLKPGCQTKDTVLETVWDHESKQLRKEFKHQSTNGEDQAPDLCSRSSSEVLSLEIQRCCMPLASTVVTATAVIRKPKLEEGSTNDTPNRYRFVWNQATPFEVIWSFPLHFNANSHSNCHEISSYCLTCLFPIIFFLNIHPIGFHWTKP